MPSHTETEQKKRKSSTNGQADVEAFIKKIGQDSARASAAFGSLLRETFAGPNGGGSFQTLLTPGVRKLQPSVDFNMLDELTRIGPFGGLLDNTLLGVLHDKNLGLFR